MYSLHALRELAISKVNLSASSVVELAETLRGHRSLAVLELWNVGLEDEAALALARMASSGGNGALRQLNLGRNLISGTVKVALNPVVS